MPADPSDPDQLDRVLGIAPDPRDAHAAAEALAIAAALRDVAVPPALLPGWQSLCADEYAEAVHALRRSIAHAQAALAAAADAAR